MSTSAAGATTAALAVPVAAFDAQVVAVHRLSPSFLRVTFAGDDLLGFADPGPLGPRDLRVKLVLPVDGGTATPAREWSFDDGWYPRWLAAPPQRRGAMRTYTVRSFRDRPDPRLVVDVVLHGPQGPAGAWAASVRPGDVVTVLGPRRGADGYGGIAWRPPGRAARLLLVADETAVPAAAAILETLPAESAGHAVLEVPHARDVLPLDVPAGMAVTWLPRAGRTRGRATLDALAAVLPSLIGAGTRPEVPAAQRVPPDPADELLWEVAETTASSGRYAWVAGEAGVVRAVRHVLLGAGLARDEVAAMGYWRAS